MGSKDWYEILEHEFAGEDDTFLGRLHMDNVWDEEAFERLTDAMRACCEAYDDNMIQPPLHNMIQPPLPGMERAYDRTLPPRWLAAGFWYCYTEIEGYAHRAARQEATATDADKYSQGYYRLFFLATRFFTGD
jgi:hypothetical protein